MEKILTFIAKMEIGYLVLAMSFFGVYMSLLGIVVDLNEQIELLRQSKDAFQQYLTAMDHLHIKSVFQYLLASIQMQLPSIGGNIIGLGMLVAYAGTPISVATVYVARHFADQQYSQDACFNKYYALQS